MWHIDAQQQTQRQKGRDGERCIVGMGIWVFFGWFQWGLREGFCWLTHKINYVNHSDMNEKACVTAEGNGVSAPKDKSRLHPDNLRLTLELICETRKLLAMRAFICVFRRRCECRMCVRCCEYVWSNISRIRGHVKYKTSLMDFIIINHTPHPESGIKCTEGADWLD